MIALLIGGIGQWLPATKKWRRVFHWGSGLLLVVLLINTIYFRPEGFLTSSDEYYYIDEERIQESMSGILPDFIPSKLAVESFDTRGEVLPPRHQADWQTTFNDEAITFEKRSEAAHFSSYIVNAPQEAVITWPIAAFPGWEYAVDGDYIDSISPISYQANAVDQLSNLIGVSEQGLITTRIPAGEHIVDLYFGSTPTRNWANIISAVSLFIFAVIYLVPAFTPKNR